MNEERELMQLRYNEKSTEEELLRTNWTTQDQNNLDIIEQDDVGVEGKKSWS